MAKLSPEKRQIFLDYIAKGLSLTKSADAIGISRQAMHAALKKDPEFDAAYDSARESGYDRLEDEAIRRAIEGESDTLLIFMLKAGRPERYRDRYEIKKQETITHKIELSQLSDQQLRQILTAVEALDNPGVGEPKGRC